MQKRLPLHRRHRPESFDDVVGNKDTIQSLQSFVERKDRPTTYMLQGPRGCGKTTVARIFAGELGGQKTGVKEYNIASMRGIGTARGIIETSRLKPLSGGAKVIILNECHKATNEFWNAMLEVLEEPPKNTYFILCTTEPQKVLPTVKSRCTRYDLRPLNSREMTRFLRGICTKERADLEIPTIKKIWKAVEGTPREALVLLDQIISQPMEAIDDVINTFANHEANLMDLVNALVGNAKWKIIAPIIKNLNEDPESVRHAIIAIIGNMMLRQPTDTLSEIGTLFEESFIYSGKFGLINACFLSTKIRK